MDTIRRFALLAVAVGMVGCSASMSPEQVDRYVSASDAGSVAGATWEPETWEDRVLVVGGGTRYHLEDTCRYVVNASRRGHEVREFRERDMSGTGRVLCKVCAAKAEREVAR